MAISTQTQNLNLIPGKSAPVVVHLSQGNVGNTVQFYLYDGDDPYYPTNVSIAVHGVRADNTVFGPYAVSVTSGSNLVSFDIVTAMTSVTGAAIGELVISDSNENQIGSANFGMLVEETPYSSSVTYEDDLSIYQRILAYVQSVPAELQSQISEEASTRSSAVTSLQSQISEEASTRSSAVTSLQSQISEEASTRSSDVSNLQSQINQIVAPSGAAPSAAEIQNARIGADNVTYPTLGDAIRGQVTDLNSVLNEYFDTGLRRYALTWEQGGINTSTGKNVASSAAIRSQFIPYEKTMLVTCESGYKFNCFYYDSNKDFITSEQNKQGAWVIEKRSNAKWMRVRVVKSAGGDITPSQAPDLKIFDMPFNTSKHIVFDTVADMKKIVFTYPNAIFETKGYYAVGDGGGATYIVSPYAGDLGATAPNINIQLDNGYYAKLLYGKTLYAKQIGCKSDDQAFDNSVVVNQVTNNSHFANCTLVFEKGVYYFNNGILDTQTVHLIGEHPLNYYSYDKNYDSRLIFTNVIDQTYYSAIYANRHTLISDLFIYATFVTFTEDRSLIGSTSNPNDAWLTFNVTKENTVGIRVAGMAFTNYNSTIQNCVVRGFSTGIMLHPWSCVRDCLIMECDGYGIIANNDDQIRGCRIQYCGYGIRSGNLAIISDIRFDSIKHTGIKCNGSNALIFGIHGDYVGESLVSVDGVTGLVASCISGRCGVNYVNAENNMVENDKRMCALVSLSDTDFVAISAMNGRTRELDDGTLLKNTKAVSLNNVSEINISMSGDADGDLTQASFSEVAFIGSDGNVSGGLHINGCLYNLKNANNQYSNIFKPDFVNI